MKKLLVLLALVFVFSSFCHALDNPDSALKQVIEDHLRGKFPDWKNDRIEITLNYADRVAQMLKDLPEDAKLSVLELYSEVKPVGNMIFPIQVKKGDLNLERIFIRTKIEVFKKVVVARQAVLKDKIISSDDIALEERNIALFPQKYFTVMDEVLNKEAQINISDKSTIFEWMVKASPTVKQFDDVSIVVKGEGLVVKAKGKAMEDGYVGRTIKVRRADTQDMLNAEVLNANEVEVILK